MRRSTRTAELVYIGVGSNLGNRPSFLELARDLVQKLPATRFLRSSQVHETDPVGGPPQGKFLNAVWEIETRLPPVELKDRLLQIEEKLGRKRTVQNAPREIDLDILFYGDRVVQGPGLEIPHPRLRERLFVLVPLAELVPDKTHPQLKKLVRQLLYLKSGEPPKVSSL